MQAAGWNEHWQTKKNHLYLLIFCIFFDFEFLETQCLTGYIHKPQLYIATICRTQHTDADN